MQAPILNMFDIDRWYIGNREAQPHPARPGEYLTAVLGGTLLPLPKKIPANHTPRLSADGSAWEVQEDHFGREGWLDGEPYTIKTHGLPPEGWSAEKPAPAPPTPEEQLAMFTAAIQGHLDSFAQTRNYDGIMSAATYATSTVEKFRAEGQYAVEARDATWAAAYAILDAVMSGVREMPKIEDVLAELPPLAWPE